MAVERAANPALDHTWWKPPGLSNAIQSPCGSRGTAAVGPDQGRRTAFLKELRGQEGSELQRWAQMQEAIVHEVASWTVRQCRSCTRPRIADCFP
jgi:hypothetical protein